MIRYYSYCLIIRARATLNIRSLSDKSTQFSIEVVTTTNYSVDTGRVNNFQKVKRIYLSIINH